MHNHSTQIRRIQQLAQARVLVKVIDEITVKIKPSDQKKFFLLKLAMIRWAAKSRLMEQLVVFNN